MINEECLKLLKAFTTGIDKLSKELSNLAKALDDNFLLLVSYKNIEDMANDIQNLISKNIKDKALANTVNKIMLEIFKKSC